MNKTLNETLINKPIKEIIIKIFGDKIFIQKEKKIAINNNTYFKADTFIELNDNKFIIIEDDDAMRCVSNMSKYWFWLNEKENKNKEIYFFHIIGPGLSSHKELCKFIHNKIKELTNIHFEYTQIEVSDWHTDNNWKNELEKNLLNLKDYLII